MFQYRIMYISASSMFDNRYVDMFNITLSMDDCDKYHNERILNVINRNEPYFIIGQGGETGNGLSRETRNQTNASILRGNGQIMFFKQKPLQCNAI